jgi:cyclopropane-fatty-acyl-phospholipid synthase
MKSTLLDLLRTAANRLPDVSFEVCFWDGERAVFGAADPAFTINIVTKEAAKRIFGRGSTGFREEYVAGNIEVEGDLKALLRLGMDPRIQCMALSLKARAAILLQYLKSLNTIAKAPSNIARHYDLGDDFFKQYLDTSMTYSCAYFRRETDSLEEAQQHKYEHICRKLQLREGESLIDIGCGWGGMLVYAARNYGITGVGCTLSARQADYAKEVVEREGLKDRITILLKDYREVTGTFDKFVSIGMFEHVGKSFVSTFMEKTRGLLKEGGLGLLHTIGKERPTGCDPWTMKYIFPGAYIPVLDHMIRAMGQTSLVPVDIENLRLHYAATLEEWARRFETNMAAIKGLADSTTIRMWRMYLNGCAAAFRWGDVRLYQILFTNGLNNAIPMTREHLYMPGDGPAAP